jgi:CheY-like chemotaxis protein
MMDSLKLLLADDDLDDCDLFRQALSELPFEATLEIVHDGNELLIQLPLQSMRLPDIIFLDLNMPRKNGVECLTAIKTSEILQHIPVVIFSTSVNEKLAKSLFSMGAADYIQKPSSYRELKELISNTILSIPLHSPKLEKAIPHENRRPG